MSSIRPLFALFALASAGCSLAIDASALNAGCDEGEQLQHGKCVSDVDVRDVCKSTEYRDGNTCIPLTVCTPDAYEITPPSDVSDRVCQPLRECPPGTYVERESQAHDRMCLPCKTGEFSAQANAPSCDVWQPACAGLERETLAPSALRDRVCGPCGENQYLDLGTRICEDLVDCEPGEYVSTLPTPTQQRACASCTQGTFSSSFNARECTAWTACAPGTVQVSEASASNDTGCAPCEEGSFESAGKCVALTDCGPGTYIYRAETSTQDRVCRDCLPGAFAATTNEPSCEPWTECTFGSESVAPDAVRDRVCSACGKGRFGSAASCQNLTVCSRGEYESTLPTGQTDRACTACADGTFSKDENALSCTPLRECGDKWFVSKDPGSDHDRECTPCQDLLTSYGPNARACEVDYTVSAGFGSACALQSSTGKVTCWSKSPSALPTSAFSKVDVVKTSGPNFGGCGLRYADRHLECWGNAGLAATTSVPNVPFLDFSIGAEHACGVIQSNNHVICWGNAGANGLLTKEPEGAFASLDVTQDGACGLTSTGELHCWGEWSQWNAPGGAEYTSAPDVPFKSVSTGVSFVCGITMDDALACWGTTTGNRFMITPPDAQFASVSVGYTHACGLTVDHQVLCWGFDGAPGAGLGVVSATPTGPFASVSAGVHHNCGVRLDTGRIQCWGTLDEQPPVDLRQPE
jgi:hypothetical protein